ncbi:MAG: AAA family ATPase, partial [Myxococcota bacterium]
MPSALEQLVLRCLAKDPAKRYPHMAMLRAALSRALTRPGEVTGQIAVDPVRVQTRATVQRATVLWFRSAISPTDISRLLGAFGGILAFTHGEQYVVVFDQQASRAPARRAVQAARALAARQVSQRFRIDIVPVRTHRRSDGSRYFFSEHFARGLRELRPSDPTGILASPDVLRRLDEAPLPGLARRSDGWRLIGLDAHSSSTAVFTDPGSHPLFGRGPLLHDLRANARNAVSRRIPAIATVLGDPGHGKSHVRAELRQKLQQDIDDALFLDHTVPEPISGSSSDLLRAILMRVLELPAMLSVADRRQLVAERLGPVLFQEVWSGLALALDWLPAGDPALRARAPAPGALRTTAARAVGLILRHCAQRRPLLIILDDAHFADQLTLDALEVAALVE